MLHVCFNWTVANLLKYMTGWWFRPLWKILVSWDDCSQYMEKNPNYQPDERMAQYWDSINRLTYQWWSFAGTTPRGPMFQNFSVQALPMVVSENRGHPEILFLIWLVAHHNPIIFPISFIISLVGGIPTPLKNMTSSVGMILPNIWTNKCSKPPTRYLFLLENTLKSILYI